MLSITAITKRHVSRTSLFKHHRHLTITIPDKKIKDSFFRCIEGRNIGMCDRELIIEYKKILNNSKDNNCLKRFEQLSKENYGHMTFNNTEQLKRWSFAYPVSLPSICTMLYFISFVDLESFMAGCIAGCIAGTFVLIPSLIVVYCLDLFKSHQEYLIHLEILKVITIFSQFSPFSPMEQTLANNALKYSSKYGYPEIVRLLLNNADKENIEHIAKNTVEYGNIEVLNIILKRIDPGFEGNILIRTATDNKHIYIIKMLLSYETVDPYDNLQIIIESNGDLIKRRYESAAEIARNKCYYDIQKIFKERQSRE